MKNENELKKMQRASLVKMFVIVMIVVAFAVFGSVAWFTQSREVEGSGVQMTAENVPYIIETRGDSGYYKSQYDTLHSEALEWKITSEHNLDNHSSAKKESESQPALEPGDHGSLEFRVSPQSADTLTVDCLFQVKIYLEEESKDENNNTVTTITEIQDSALAGYLSAHMLLFSGYNSETGKYTNLIDNDNEFLERILENQSYTKGENVYTTIYWYWPEHLSDLTDSSNAIYAPSESQKVIAYIARNKDGFFKDCTKTTQQVQTEITSLYTTYSNAIYNCYNLRYDNADLDIGNNISYVILSMQVKQ